MFQIICRVQNGTQNIHKQTYSGNYTTFIKCPQKLGKISVLYFKSNKE